MLKTVTIRTALLACTCALSICAHAIADSPKQVSVPAGDLALALEQLAKQSGVEFVYSAEELKGLHTNGVQGELTAEKAVTKLLEGTRLILTHHESGALLIGRPPGPGASRSAVESTHAMRLAQTEANTSVQSERSESENFAIGSASQAFAEAQKNRIALEEIVVTGTNIRGAAPVGSNLLSIGRKEMDAEGFTSVQDVIQAIPQNSRAGGLSDYGAATQGRGNNTTLGTGINLRGLGPRASLVLLNGRRLAPSGFGTFVDVSTIPLSALERVEVLADGASATYGSDAVAGVVNFVMRRDYEGVQSSVGYRDTTQGGGRELQLSQLFGTRWSTGGVLVGYEYTDRDNILSSERAATASCDLAPAGGGNFCSLQSSPGNIIRIGTTNVTLAIPGGQDGTQLDASELLAGQTNYFNERSDLDVLPGFERHGGFVSLRQNLTERLELFAEGLYGRRNYLYQSRQPGQNLAVPESNAYRQLNGLFPGQGTLTIQYGMEADIGPTRISGYSEGGSATAGVALDLSATWSAELHTSYTSQRDWALQVGSLDSAALTSALNSSDLATSFNPFADGSNSPASVLAAISGRSTSQELDAESLTHRTKADGRIFDLPAGPARLAAGMELRQERVLYDQVTTSSTGVSIFRSGTDGVGGLKRDVWAAFSEVSVPLIGATNQLPGFESLALSASVRSEDYSRFGRTTNPKFGLSWSPFSQLTLRGTYGTSFSVAQLNDMLSPTIASVAPVPVTIDPKATGGSTQTLLVAGGNPDLEPEEGEAYTVGARIAPAIVPGLELDLTFFDITIEDAIARISDIRPVFSLDSQYIAAGLLIRNPTPEQVAAAVARTARVTGVIDPATVEAILFSIPENVAQLATRGFDIQLGYNRDTEIGRLGFVLRGNYIMELSQNPAPGLATQRNEGKVGFPSKFNGRATLSWSRGPWSAGTSFNYVEGHLDHLSVPSRSVDSWLTADAQVSYAVNSAGSAPVWLSGTRVSLSAFNLTDEAPPFVNNAIGVAYDLANASPVGREFSLRFSKDW